MKISFKNILKNKKHYDPFEFNYYFSDKNKNNNKIFSQIFNNDNNSGNSNKGDGDDDDNKYELFIKEFSEYTK